jgi:hypothetical protein
MGNGRSSVLDCRAPILEAIMRVKARGCPALATGRAGGQIGRSADSANPRVLPPPLRVLPSRLTAAALVLVLWCGPAAAADVTAEAEYAITLGGTRVATVEVSLSDGGGRYEISASARITGVAQLVASGSARLSSTGRSTASGLDAQKFAVTIRSGGEDVTVGITYGNAGVSSFQVTPPVVNTIDRVAIERSQLSGVNDMVAPFIVKGGRLDQGLCNRKMRIFTGLERFDLTLRYAKDDVATSKRTGYQGPVVVCHLGYTPIAGHYTSSEITSELAGKDRILIWYAPLGTPGYFIPYRILVTTTSGDLSMVLTALKEGAAAVPASAR